MVSLFSLSVTKKELALIIGISVFTIILVLVVGWIIIVNNQIQKKKSKMDKYLGYINQQMGLIFDSLNTIRPLINENSKTKDDLSGSIELVKKDYIDCCNKSDVFGLADVNDRLIALIVKCNEQIPALQKESSYVDFGKVLYECESKIYETSFLYNDFVNKYNKQIKRFPDVLVANMFRFYNEDLFTVKKV